MAFISLLNKTSVGFSSVLVAAMFVFTYCEGVPTYSVDKAQNSTICPFFVTSNRNETRWPVEIKEITCIKHTKHSCCNHHYECVQLTDTLEVYSKSDRKDSWVQDFKVGCVCLKKDVEAPIIADRPSFAK